MREHCIAVVQAMEMDMDMAMWTEKGMGMGMGMGMEPIGSEGLRSSFATL